MRIYLDPPKYEKSEDLEEVVQKRMSSAMLLKGKWYRWWLHLMAIICVVILCAYHPVLVAVGIVGIFYGGLWIFLGTEECNKISIDCLKCNQKMEKISYRGGIEAFVCHDCKLIADGADYST